MIRILYEYDTDSLWICYGYVMVGIRSIDAQMFGLQKDYCRQSNLWTRKTVCMGPRQIIVDQQSEPHEPQTLANH